MLIPDYFRDDLHTTLILLKWRHTVRALVQILRRCGLSCSWKSLKWRRGCQGWLTFSYRLHTSKWHKNSRDVYKGRCRLSRLVITPKSVALFLQHSVTPHAVCHLTFVIGIDFFRVTSRLSRVSQVPRGLFDCVILLLKLFHITGVSESGSKR